MTWSDLADGTKLDRALHDLDSQTVQLVPLLETMRRKEPVAAGGVYIDGTVLQIGSLKVKFESSLHDSIAQLENYPPIQCEIKILRKKNSAKKSETMQAARCLIANYVTYRELFFVQALMKELFSIFMGNSTSIYGHHNLENFLPELKQHIDEGEVELGDMRSKLECMSSKQSVESLDDLLHQELEAAKRWSKDGRFQLDFN